MWKPPTGSYAGAAWPVIRCPPRTPHGPGGQSDGRERARLVRRAARLGGHARGVQATNRRTVPALPATSYRAARTSGLRGRPSVRLDRHLHRLALPAPGDQATLQELIGDLITPPLDRSRPLWHAYLIEGFGAGCVLLVRIDHCIADGIALARVTVPDRRRSTRRRDRAAAADCRGREPGAPALPAAVRGRGAERHPQDRGDGRARGPRVARAPQHAAHSAGVVAQDAGTLAKLLAAPADADTVLRQPLHGAPRGVVGPVPARADQGRRPALRGNCQCGW